jgi:hypothetical protein
MLLPFVRVKYTLDGHGSILYNGILEIFRYFT